MSSTPMTNAVRHGVWNAPAGWRLGEVPVFAVIIVTSPRLRRLLCPCPRASVARSLVPGFPTISRLRRSVYVSRHYATLRLCASFRPQKNYLCFFCRFCPFVSISPAVDALKSVPTALMYSLLNLPCVSARGLSKKMREIARMWQFRGRMGRNFAAQNKFNLQFYEQNL